jgi:DNA processing protein
MDREAVCALLARAPALCADHLQALVSAAGGDLTRSLELETLNQVQLPSSARVALVYPDSTALSRDLRWIANSGVQLLASTEPNYPAELLQLRDAPAVLFVLGAAQLLSARQIAIVGTRRATPAGNSTAREFAAYFAQAGITVTSGLALGIDAASHEGALHGGGTTLAVCATGLDRVYPAQHRRLAAEICASGALVSEFPPGTAPRQMNFPRRNRLISALSMGTLVVEAADRSGSLLTARRASELGRPVFAIPGHRSNPVSSGCHQLIRSGATLVEAPAEVLQSLKIPFPKERLIGHPVRRRKRMAMDKGYEMLLDALGFEPATVDVLVLRTGLSGEVVASMLLTLELEGRIAPYPGGRFGRIP